MRFLLALALSFAPSLAMAQADSPPSTPYTDAQAKAAAPVQTVNTAIGNVVIPNICRQQSLPTTIPTTNPGTLAWTFPLASNPSNCAFATAPTCWSDISVATTGAVFDYPFNTTRATTGVSYTYTAHTTSVNVVVAGVTIVAVGGTSGAPPSGATVVLTCTAPPA